MFADAVKTERANVLGGEPALANMQGNTQQLDDLAELERNIAFATLGAFGNCALCVVRACNAPMCVLCVTSCIYVCIVHLLVIVSAHATYDANVHTLYILKPTLSLIRLVFLIPSWMLTCCYNLFVLLLQPFMH